LTSEALKTKRHYNSFSPRVGFFIPLVEVRAWFEEEKGNPDGDVNGDRQKFVRVRFLIFIFVKFFFFSFGKFCFPPCLVGVAPRARKV